MCNNWCIEQKNFQNFGFKSAYTKQPHMKQARYFRGQNYIWWELGYSPGWKVSFVNAQFYYCRCYGCIMTAIKVHLNLISYSLFTTRIRWIFNSQSLERILGMVKNILPVYIVTTLESHWNYSGLTSISNRTVSKFGEKEKKCTNFKDSHEHNAHVQLCLQPDSENLTSISSIGYIDDFPAFVDVEINIHHCWFDQFRTH